MAESSKALADKPSSSPQEPNGGSINSEQLREMFRAARERATNNPGMSRSIRVATISASAHTD